MNFLIVSIIIFFYYFFASKNKWDNAVTLFTTFIILSGIFAAKDQLFGIIDHRIIVSILIILTYYFYPQNLITVKYKYLDKNKKYSIILIIIAISVMRYIEIKNLFLDIDYILLFNDEDLITILKRTAKGLLFIFSSYLIIKRLYNYKTYKSIEKGFLFGLSLAILSMIYPNIFLQWGFTLEMGIDEGKRLTGLLGMQSNQAGALFNIIYGFLLAKKDGNLKFEIHEIVIITLIIIGLIIIASKAGLVIFITLTFVYLVRNKISFKSLTKTILVSALAISLFYGYGNYFAKRISDQMSGEEDTFGARVNKWQIYIKNIQNNPNYLFFGNDSPPQGTNRAPHNHYIYIIFFSGVIPFYIFLRSFYKIATQNKKYKANNLSFSPIYSLLALLIAWGSGALLLNYWAILVFSMSAGIPKVYEKINTSKYEIN